MEEILSLYAKPYDPQRPVVCMDETSKQLVGNTREAIALQPGQPRRFDTEYERKGVANLFLAFEPLASKRVVVVTERRTTVDWAYFIKHLLDHYYAEVEQVVLVMDNLNTHHKASLYAAFPAHEAKRLADKLEIHYTPKHGSWLNMAEIEFSILSRQCLERRIDSRASLEHEVKAWEYRRNAQQVEMDWRFKVEDARTKLKRLYPSY